MPMFIARGGHLKWDLPEMLDVLRSTYPNIVFLQGDPIGEHEKVIQAMAIAVHCMEAAI